MTGYLLDTNVVSEALKARPDPTAMEWMSAHRDAAQFLSVLTVAELYRGVATLRRRNPVRAAPLAARVEALDAQYNDRVLGVDVRVARAWADLPVTRTLPVIDSLLAATAAVHELVLVTRNIGDVADLGVSIQNPWDRSTW